MNNKILYKCLPLFLSIVLVFGCSLTAFAYDGNSDTYTWDGDLLFHDQNFTIPLLTSFSNEEMVNEDGDVLQRYKVASFNGSTSNLLQVTGTVGTYLNGVATTSYTFTTDAPYEGILSIGLTGGSYDGLTVSASGQSYVNNQSVVKVFVTFNNFEITSETMYFPIQFDVSYASKYDEVYMTVPYAVSVSASGSDWTDQIAMYTSMDNLPGSKGVIGRFFDGIKTHLTSLFNGLKQNDNENLNSQLNSDLANTNIIANQIYNSSEKINNQNILNSQNENIFNRQNSENEMANDDANSQAEIAQSKENTDNLMNGFDTEKSDVVSSDITDGLASLEPIEDELFTLGISSFAEFSFSDSIPEDVSGSLSFISSILQSIFESSGEFGFIVACSFSFIVFRMIIGQAKFI